MICAYPLGSARLVNFSSIFAQQTGCPMGGSCSAQYASIVLNYLERSVDWTLLPPIVRYRDNYLVYASPLWSPHPQSFVRSSPSIDSAQQFLTQVKRTISCDSTLKLTVEGWGQSMPFLDFEVLISGGLPNIEVKSPVFATAPGDSQPAAHRRLLDCQSPNSQRMLLSLVPNLVKKCAWYRFDTCSFIQNVRKVSSLLIRKGYPSTWWRPLLLAKAETIGLQQHARSTCTCTTAQTRSGRIELRRPTSKLNPKQCTAVGNTGDTVSPLVPHHGVPVYPAHMCTPRFLQQGLASCDLVCCFCCSRFVSLTGYTSTRTSAF